MVLHFIELTDDQCSSHRRGPACGECSVHGIHYHMTLLIVFNDKCSAGIADVQLTLTLGWLISGVKYYGIRVNPIIRGL